MIGKKINQLATELAPVSTDLTIIGDPTTGVSKKITLAQLGAIFSGAVSFYTNLAGFPATGDINVIYCAKDTQKLYLWSGSAYVEVFPSQALLDTYQLRSEKGVSNGYASLDSTGKVPISQLPSSIMEYKGTWNAATNTPTLANGTGDTGDVYICNVAGTVNFGAGPITFAVGDYVIYSGSIWQRSSGAVGTVTSVAASITGNAIGITGSPVTTSGTLAFAFAGTGAQYIKGDGTLATFPSTIAQAERLITEVYNSTGATLTKGTIVYINGGQGNLPTVTKALATGDSTSAQTFGVVQADITNNNNGYVVVAGKLSDLDTQAYTEGTQLYLSSTTAGAWTSTKQYAPAHLVYVGVVVRAHPTQGIVEIKIQNGYELDELHNVAAQTPTNNDGLFWESATSLWKNKSIATVLGYTPQAQLNGTGFVKASGTTISYDNSTYVTTDTNQTITGIKTFNNITNFNQNIIGGIVKLSQGVLLSKAANIGTDPGHITLLAQGITGTNYIYFADGDNIFNTQRFAIPTTGTYTYTLQAASGTLAFTSDLTGGTVTSVGLSSATSGVTIGSTPITTSGTITLAIATASGSQQGLLSSTDWTTFNNKQAALTNPVTGTGTTNYLPKFTGTSTIGNSIAQDNGSRILINTGTANQNTTINASKIAMSRTSDGAEVVYFSKNTDLGSEGTANINGYDGIQFRTQGAESVKATLNASGNLSIGNTNDTYKLDVSGTGRFTSSVTATQGIFRNSGVPAIQVIRDLNVVSVGTAGQGIEFGALNGSTPTAGAAIYGALDNPATTGLMVFQTLTAGSLTTKLTIASTGAATFSSSVTATGGLISNGGSIGYGGGELGFGVTSSGATSAIYTLAVDSPVLYFDHRATGNTGFWVWRNGSGAGSERMRLNASGNLSIGNTNDTYKLDVSGVIRANGGKILVTGVNSNWLQSTQNSTNAQFQTWYASDGTTRRGYFGYGSGGSDNFTLMNEANGQLAIGTNSISALTIASTGAATFSSTIEAARYLANSSSASLVAFGVSAGNGMYNAGTDVVAFSTASTERIRITSGGEVLMNMTSAVGSETLNLTGKISGSAQYGIFFQLNPNTYTSYAARFFNSGSSAVVGSITMGTSSTSYNTSSDYRLKTDYKDFSGLDLVSKIKAYDYEWKSDKSRSYGVIAHELQSVINYAVTGVKDGEQMQGVDYSKIVPVLIKAIQELNDKIK